MANKLKPATKADGGKVIKALLKEGISKVEDTFGISNMAIQNVVYTNSTYYPECSVGCVLIEAHGEVVEDIITIMKKLGYRHAEDFGDGIVLVFAPKGVSDSDIGDALNGKINESVDISVSENVRSKIINYAQQRLNKSGAVLLAPVYDIINFNDPLDGMISFDYLNTIAENEELSEEESGYDYIEQAVTDIADFIQKQGYIMDEESDDPLIFIDENYDEEDEELEDMNESVKWTETDEPNQWVNKLTRHKEAIDPITLECKDLGVALFASKLSEDGNFYKVMVVNTDTGKSITKSMPFDGIDLESAISKLKKCDNKDDLYNTISKYLFVRKESVSKLFGTNMNESTEMNEAASIKKSDRYREFDLLPKGKGWMDPIELTNRDAGFYAIAGTAYDSTDRNNEDEWGIVVSLTPLDSKYEDILITGSFYDYEEAAEGIMNRLSRAKTPMDVARIIKNQEFSDEWGDDESEFLSALTKSFGAQNESTNVMNESVQVSKPKPNEAKNHYISKEGSLMIQNKKLGFYAIVGDYYDEDDPEFEGDTSAYISKLGTANVSIDNKKINEVLETTFDNRNKANTMIKELSDVDNLTDLAKILRKYEFYNSDIDTTKGQRGFISLLEGKLDSVNESTMMINESAQIRPCDPALEGFDLLDSNNPFDFEPVDLENTALGFYAIAGVATGADVGADWIEDDCSIEICITALDPEYSDEVLVAEYYDIDYKAMSVMQELASATSYNKLTSILVKEGFQGMNSGPFDFVEDLEAINSMNEATEVPDGRMTVELDDTDVIEGDTLLLAELTDDVFNAVNAVLDELDPDADVEITIDNEDLLQLAVVSDEDLDDDAFDQVLSELLEDMDLEDIVADMTDSEPIEDPEDEDFGRVIQYINFYPSTGATVVPDNSVMEDNVDVIEDEDVINESFKLNTDLTKFVDKLADSFFGSIKDANFLNLEDEDGNLYFQVSTGDKSYSRKLLTNFLAFLAKKNVDFDLVNKVNVTGNSTFWNATVTVKINNKQGSQVQYRNELNESVDPIYESYYKDTDEDLSIDQAKITKALKAISRILTKEGYPLDNLDRVYRFNYPRPGLVEINLINTLKSTYGRISDKAYDIDSKIEKKLESLNLTYASKDKYGKEIYTDDDKLVHYDGKDISKYIQTGKVPDREFRNNRVDAVHPKLEDIAKGITEYLTSHPTYKKYNTYGYEPVNVGADYISIKVEVANVEYGKEILSDTDKYIKKNYKDLYPIIRSNPPDKKYPYIYYSLLDTGRPLGHLMKSEYEMRGSSIKKLMNESVDDDNSEAIGSYDYSESAKSTKLPTQSELKTIIQKSMIKFGERHTQVTVHAYRTSKYEGGVVEVDLDGTSLATDGREEDYYDEDNIKNALEYAAKELVDKFGQDKDLLDYIDVQYNKVGSLTITFSLDSELNESYSINEATKVTFHFDDQKDWVSPEDFKKIEKFATKMEDALERYLRRLRDLGPDDKLKDQVYTEIRVENKEKIIIETKTKKKVLKKDIDRLYAKGNGPSPSTNLSQLPLEDVKATNRGIGWFISPIDKSLTVYVYTGFKSLAEPWDPTKAKAEWDAAHPKKPASALKSKLEEIAKGIEKYVKSNPDYNKFNLSKDVVHVGEDYIQITVDTPDVEVSKSILIDTDKFISKNYKDLETHSKSKDGSKQVWSVYVMKSSAAKDLMNESTKFDFDNLEEVLEEDLESDIDLPDYADNIIVSSYPTGQGYGVKATFDDRLVKDNKLRIIGRIVKTVSDRCGKDYDLDHHHDKMKGEYSLTFSFKSKLNESTDHKKVADKLETSVNKDVDLKDGDVVISVDENDYGYDIIAEFDNRLLGSNPNKTIGKVVDSVVKRNGKYSDLVHYNNKATGKYRVILFYKGQLNECAIIGPEETDIDTLRANELSRALSSEQPLVDPYDIRCTIRPVFVRKDQFLFDGSTVYKATANASTDKDSGTTEIKVDVLLSNDPDVTDASTTLTLPTEFDGLKLLRGNPTKVYNEATDVKDNTVKLSFANEEDAKEFIKDNELKPEDSYNGKFGWVVVLKKSDLKKIK